MRLLCAQDVLLRSTDQQWHVAVRTVPALPALVRLLRCWAQRRALQQQPDGFTGFFWSMFAVHLVQQGKLVGALAAVAALTSAWLFVPPLH